MKNKEINSGLTGKKNSHSMISSALEDFFKVSLPEPVRATTGVDCSKIKVRPENAVF